MVGDANASAIEYYTGKGAVIEKGKHLFRWWWYTTNEI